MEASSKFTRRNLKELVPQSQLKNFFMFGVIFPFFCGKSDERYLFENNQVLPEIREFKGILKPGKYNSLKNI
jgi:hypothetical protein